MKRHFSYMDKDDWLMIGFLVIVVLITVVIGGISFYQEVVREPYEGNVVYKGYDSAHTTYVNQTIGNTTTMIPVTDDEDWFVMVDDGTKDDKYIELPKDKWDNVELGDYIKEDK